MKEKFELWKDIPEYEGLYQVSNFGRVKSLERTIIHKDGKKYTYSERILKHKKQKNGYLYVSLSKDGKIQHLNTHRLVALVFLKNPYNLPIINHKDENKENNFVDNLEWCSIKYNTNYGTRNERISKAKKGKYIGENNPFYKKHHSKETKQRISEANRKPILQYTKESVFIREWDSITQAEQKLNLSHITACCKGKLKTSGGFIWRYKE